MKNKITEMTCQKCSHQWTSKSQNVFVTCPSCLGKVRVRETKPTLPTDEN